MNFCKACGKTVHESAANCPHCGAVQTAVKPAALTTHKQAPLWTSITGMVLGIVPVLSLFEPKDWSKEQIVGATLFDTAALVLGIVSLAKHHRGKGMAIAAVVLGAVGLLAAIAS